MKFVEQDSGDPVERRVVEDHAGKDALRDDLDSRAGRNTRLEPHAQADRIPDALAEGPRHAIGGRPRGETTRLEHDDTAWPDRLAVEQRQRHASRLAGARWSDQNGTGHLGEARLQLRKNLVDRQGGVELHPSVDGRASGGRQPPIHPPR